MEIIALEICYIKNMHYWRNLKKKLLNKQGRQKSILSSVKTQLTLP